MKGGVAIDINRIYNADCIELMKNIDGGGKSYYN